MRNVRLITVLLLVSTVFIVLYASGNKPETEFPQLSAEMNYADIEQRMKGMAETIREGAGFHEWFDHPVLEQFKDVPSYETNVVIHYNKIEKEKYILGTVEVRKTSPTRVASVSIASYENGQVGFYNEFMQGHYVVINIEKTGELNNIIFENLVGGKREIKFDENEAIVTDTYRQFDNADIHIRLENRHQMDEEISASIKAGYTDIQLQKPHEWELKLPEGLDNEEIRDRLKKIKEYRQAIIVGNALSLIDNKIFVDNEDDSIIPRAHICYSGKKVSFVGVEHLENFRTIGYFIVFDEYFRLTQYVEGEIEFDKNLTGHEVAKSAKLFLRELPFEEDRRPSGLEVTFHSSGYPASYKTIVRSEFIGRQIEWDENGNVISDIDTSPPPSLALEAAIIDPSNEETVLWSGAFLPRPGESLVDFRRRFEAEVRPLEKGEEVHLDGSISKTTKNTITLDMRELQMEVEDYPLPKASKRWIVMIVVNAVVISLLLILWRLRKWGH